MNRIRLASGAIIASLAILTLGTGCDSSDSTQATPPSVAITTPVDGQWLDGLTPFQIEATASEPSGIVSVTFRVDGQLAGEDLTRPYGVRWDPSPAADNEIHVVTATAVDTEGDEAEASISIGLHTLIDTWSVVKVEDENGNQTAAFLAVYSSAVFDFTDTGTFSATFVESGTGAIRAFSGSFKATSGGAGSSLSMTFVGPNVNVPWEAVYTWDDTMVVVEGPADELNVVLGINLTGVLKLTMVVPPLESS